MADRCSFCGSTAGPLNRVGGLFTVLRVPTAMAAPWPRQQPVSAMTAHSCMPGLDLLPTWVLEQNGPPSLHQVGQPWTSKARLGEASACVPTSCAQ